MCHSNLLYNYYGNYKYSFQSTLLYTLLSKSLYMFQSMCLNIHQYIFQYNFRCMSQCNYFDKPHYIFLYIRYNFRYK